MSNERFSFAPLEQHSLQPELAYLSLARYGTDWNSMLHTHAITEILFVTDGEGKLIMDSRAVVLKKGDLAVVNPHVPHTETSTFENPLTYLVLGIDKVYFSSLNDYPPPQNETDNDCPTPIFHLQAQYKRIFGILNEIRAELEEKEEFYELAVQGLLSYFLVFLMRNTSLIATHRSAPKMSRDCALIKRYIDSHFTYNFSLDELSEKIYVTKFYLIHIFKKYVGMSPGAYILEKRMTEAKQLLINTDLTVSDICKEVGFKNSNHFTQTFKKREGVTPTGYRKNFDMLLNG